MSVALHLLTPIPQAVSHYSIDINGQTWRLVDANELPQDAKSYVCVSYAWGDAETFVPNILFGGDNKMSPRTSTVLETVQSVIGHQNTAIWIDAFCLPPRGDPHRSRSLDEMGNIYANASKVVVVLSQNSRALLELAKDSTKWTGDYGSHPGP